MGFSNKSLALATWGGLGALATFPFGESVFVVGRLLIGSLGPLPTTILVTTLWTTIIAIGCTMALIMGQNRYLRRPLMNPESAVAGIVGGAISGAVSGCVAEGFFQIAQQVGNQNVLLVLVARLLAWAMFGCLIGFGMSFVIPNLDRFAGAASGAAGGGIGAVAFIVAGVLTAGIMMALGGADAAAMVGDSLGRCVGMVILGFALGFAIGLAEEATRTAWLQVTYGQSRESVRISLGDQPVCVGSDSRRCAVWAQGARAVALKFRYVDGNVICDDIAAEKTYFVHAGHQQQVGHVAVLVCGHATPSTGGNTTVTSTSAPPPRPAPPPPAPPAGRTMPNAMLPQAARSMLNTPAMQKGRSPSSTVRPAPPPPPPRRG